MIDPDCFADPRPSSANWLQPLSRTEAAWLILAMSASTIVALAGLYQIAIWILEAVA